MRTTAADSNQRRHHPVLRTAVLVVAIAALVVGCSNPAGSGDATEDAGGTDGTEDSGDAGGSAGPEPVDPWVAAYGIDGFSYENVNDVAATEDGGYVLAGRTSADDEDALVVMIDKGGAVEWGRRVDARLADEAGAVVENPDGDIIIAGITEYRPSGADPASEPETAILLVRFSADGSLEDSVAFTPGPEDITIADLAVHAGRLILAATYQNGAGFLAVFGDHGSDFLGNETYEGTLAPYPINSLSIVDNDVILTLETAELLSSVPYDAGILRITDFFDSYSETGVFVLDSAPQGTNRLTDVTTTADGGYLAVGTAESFGPGGEDIWAMKLDSTLAVEWQKVYGGSEDDNSEAVLRVGGDIVVVGATRSYGAGSTDAWLVELASDGAIAEQRAYGGADGDRIEAAVRGSVEGMLLAGSSYSYGPGNLDFIAAKTDGALALGSTALTQTDTAATAADVNPSVTPPTGAVFNGLSSVNLAGYAIDIFGLTSSPVTLTTDRP